MTNLEKIRLIEEVLRPDWTPPRDTQWDTKYAMWLQNERVKEIERIIHGF